MHKETPILCDALNAILVPDVKLDLRRSCEAVSMSMSIGISMRIGMSISTSIRALEAVAMNS